MRTKVLGLYNRLVPDGEAAHTSKDEVLAGLVGQGSTTNDKDTSIA